MKPASPSPQTELRLRRLVEQTHRLGPAPMLHLLRELADDDEIERVLERYARLPIDLVQMYRADRFPPPALVLSGGRL